MWFNRIIRNYVSISYGITVCNEAQELDRLLSTLILLIDKNDEIIILSDKTNVTPEVLETIAKYQMALKHHSRPLNGDFATFKNTLIRKSTKKYLFQIDADEYPNAQLISKLKRFLFYHFYQDCFYVPRVNRVDGITEQHIEKWQWTVDSKNRLNFPDYQRRILKLGKDIRWEGKVHERLINYKFRKKLPCRNEDYCLYHLKSIVRQEKQNNLYDQMI